jgi:hypothetical protein
MYQLLYYYEYCFIFVIIRGGLRFEPRALHLQSRHSTTWATPLLHFSLITFGKGVSWTICLGWPQTIIILISAFQVARTIGESHWCPASYCLINRLRFEAKLVLNMSVLLVLMQAIPILPLMRGAAWGRGDFYTLSWIYLFPEPIWLIPPLTPTHNTQSCLVQRWDLT